MLMSSVSGAIVRTRALWVMLTLTPHAMAASYSQFTSGTCTSNGCSAISSTSDCGTAAAALGLSDTSPRRTGWLPRQLSFKVLPRGCFVHSGLKDWPVKKQPKKDSLWYNPISTSAMHCSSRDACVCSCNPTTAPTTSPTCPFTDTSSFLQGCTCDTFTCGSSRLPWSSRDYRFCGGCPAYLDGAYHFSCPHCASAGTELKLTCPNQWEVCDVFVSVYQSHKACSLDTDGGLPYNLMGDGWQAGSCGPSFCLKTSDTCGDADTNIRWGMTMFHKQWTGGDEISIPPVSSDPTMYFTMFVKEGVVCSAVNNQAECQYAPGMCEWDSAAGECKVKSLCPPKVSGTGTSTCCDLPPGVETGSCTAAATAITSVCSFNLPNCG